MKSLVKAGLVIAGFSASAAALAGTAAGVDITNTAVATYDGGTVSASATLQVQEIIDVAVSTSSPEVRVEAGDAAQQLPFTVQNTGNGTETFKVTYANSGAVTAENVVIYIDANNNGVIDSGEVAITGDTITLDRDERIGLIIQADIPASANPDELSKFELTVASTTEKDGIVAGTAPAGTILAGQGTGTSDAIVGNSAKQIRNAQFRIGATTQAVTISKSISGSVDPFGGNSNIPGTEVTYSITVVVDTTKGAVNNLVITDDLPSDLNYKTGSLTLGGASLTEADDATDAAKVVGNSITVDLGDITADETFNIQLTAEIK